MATTHECAYCGTTKGLRIACDERPIGRGVELICAECFTGTDTGPCFDDLPVFVTRDDHISRLRDLSECRNNRDDITIERQAINLMSGHPAYWFRGRTSGATWVVELSNTPDHDHSFLKALEAFVSRKPTIDVVGDILDNVIPLNVAAIAELQLCYRLQSTFAEDLADRERKAIFDPEFFPRMDPGMRAVWEANYAACQKRWTERYHATLKDAQSPILDLVKAGIAISSDADARAAVEGAQIAEVA